MNQQIPKRYCRRLAGQVFFALTAFALAHPTCSVYAKPLLEKTERFEIDWGSMRIRFWGEAAAESQSESLVAIEKRAWDSGLLGVRDSFAKYYAVQQQESPRESEEALQRGRAVGASLTKATYAYRNEYFGDGAVKVYMVSSLSRAIANDQLVFSQKNEEAAASSQRSSGLVLHLPGTAAPSAVYKIRDELGKVLFEAESVSRQAFEERAMGQWFVHPTQQELVRSIGKAPMILNLKEGSRCHEFISRRKDWDEAMTGNQGLLLSAKVALVVNGRKG